MAGACSAPEGTDPVGTDQSDDTAPAGDPIRDVSWANNLPNQSLIGVSWPQAVTGSTRVEYRFDDDDWTSTPARPLEPGDHQQIVIGVPYDTVADIRVVVDSADSSFTSEELAATTGAFPTDALRADVLAAQADAWDANGNYLLGGMNASTEGWSSGDYWIFIIDRKGRLVWAFLTPDRHFCLHPGPSLDGNAIGTGQKQGV